jgi:predicted ABC-type exoprotein transport system permease subunit
MSQGPDTPFAKFVGTLKIGVVFVVVSLLGFGLARYLEEGKRFDIGSWMVIAVLCVAVLVTAVIRALVATQRK